MWLHTTAGRAFAVLDMAGAVHHALATDFLGEATLMNGSNETYRVWNINVVFDAPYTGNVFAAIRVGDTWTRTDKFISLSDRQAK